MQPIVPFRWNLLAGRLPDLTGVAGEEAPWPDYRQELLALAARVWVARGEADLVFVGRSCESLFDLLGGLLHGRPEGRSLRLLLLSLAGSGERDLRSPGLRANLAAAGLAPAALLGRRRPVALVDVVASGETFQRLLRALRLWCQELRLDPAAVRRKLQVVALSDHRYSRWRGWQGRLVGLADRVRQVSVPARLWRYLADRQAKVTPSHPPRRWDDPRAARPAREPEHLAALRAAVGLAAWGREPSTRAGFRRQLGRPAAWPPPAPVAVRPAWRHDRRPRARVLPLARALAEYEA